MEERDRQTVFAVTDLKQYSYCPRIVFYTYCLPLVRPLTYKMEAGGLAHEEEGKRERRRSLAAYGLAEGKRNFDVWVESPSLGLRGRIDLVIETGRDEHRELIPVDYKQSTREVGGHVRRQLTAYGMMLEEMWKVSVRRGFVYSLASGRAVEIVLTEKMQQEVREIVGQMRDMVERERMPDPPRSHRRCENCEFRRFCNDVS
jgi:CRISPR-associated exonuclease Cas4